MARIQIDFPEGDVTFTHDMAVRIGDVNYFEHLGHDALIRMLHEARAQLFRHHGHAEWDTEGGACVVADLAVRYRAEARFGQILRVEIAPGELGTHGVELYYRVRDRDSSTLVALAKTGHVFFEGRKPRMRPVPPAFLAMLQLRPAAGVPA